MPRDSDLRDQMASELRFKEEGDKKGFGDARGAYREQLQAEMDDPARFGRRKMDAVKKGATAAFAAATTPLHVLTGASADGMRRKAAGLPYDNIRSYGEGFKEAGKNLKESVGGIGEAVRDYQSALEDEASVKREAKAELKRESRGKGMKSGGAVKGWGKARGARAAKVY